MSANGSNVIRLPVRRHPPAPPPEPLAYEVAGFQGAVMVVLGELELWIEPDQAIRLGNDLVTVGKTAEELAR